MRNTLDKLEYILNQLWYAFLAAVFFRTHCFILLFDFDKSVSSIIYWSMLVLLTLWGVKMTYKKRRNYFSVFVNCVFPNGVYMLISYMEYFTTAYKVIVLVTCAIVAVFGLMLLLTITKPNASFKKRFQNKCKLFVRGSRNIMAVGMSVMIVCIGLNVMFGNPLYKLDTPYRTIYSTKPFALNDKKESFSKLKPEIWDDSLSFEEKQEIIDDVVATEVASLGITRPVRVGYSVLDENTLGSYNSNIRQILIDIDFFKTASSKEALEVVIHEVYHAYEHDQVIALRYVPESYRGLALFNDTVKYADEFDDYTSGEEDYWAYASQRVEADADEYAVKAAAEYLEYIKD